MEGDASIEPFGFAMAGISLTKRPTTILKMATTALQRILTPLLITVENISLSASNLLSVCFFHP